MGRKIPAKKHRGVKDPLQQQARRLDSLKSKINAPPKDPDEQPVPRSLMRLFAFKENQDIQNLKKKKGKLKSPHYFVGKNSLGNGENPIKKLHKLPGESGRGFSLRINSAIRALHDSSEPQDYPPDVETEEDVKGSRMAELRRRRARRRPASAAPAPAAPSRARRRADRLNAKKDKAEETRAERLEVRYERVPFGAVAHAPPVLPVAPRGVARAPSAPRPGRRELLLSSMLRGGGGEGGARAPTPPAERLRRERARSDAIAAYRQFNKQKHQRIK